MVQRHEAVVAAYESAASRLGGMPLDVFEQITSKWEVVPVEVGGKLVGAVMMCGPVIHACIKPDGFGRWLTKSVLKKTLCKVLNEYGEAVTSVGDGNHEGEHFVSRLGFRKEGEAWVLRQQ